jgi:hypothetical protein
MSIASGAHRGTIWRGGWHWVWSGSAPVIGFVGSLGWWFDGDTVRIRFVRSDTVTMRR